jgi:hypothetical protein
VDPNQPKAPRQNPCRLARQVNQVGSQLVQFGDADPRRLVWRVKEIIWQEAI